MKACARCRQEKQLDEFIKSNRAKSGRGSYCYPCDRARKKEWREANPEHVSDYFKAYKKEWRAGRREEERNQSRKYRLKREYGLTVEQYDDMLQRQGGACAICKSDDLQVIKTGRVRALSVDHCHETGDVRGLLCSNCNVGLGYLRDSVDIIDGAIGYLQERG